MRRLLVSIFTGAALSLGAQTEEDFNRAGQALFFQITDSAATQFIPMIRIQQYLSYIDAQDWPTKKKEKQKYAINQNYGRLYQSWQESIAHLREQYLEAQANGIELKYLNTRSFPAADGLPTYAVETSLLWRSEDGQNEVIWHYELAWLPQLGLRITGPVEEIF